ncbi:MULTISPECIES: cytochrome c maturation protein CcmE [Bacteria]
MAGAILMLVGFLLFGNLNQNLVYYLTPTEAAAQKSSAPAGERFRLGGLVAEGSVVRTDEETRFTLVDDGAAIPVRLTGAPPQLFAAGIGAVVEGSWRAGAFYADTVIIKHDEEYEEYSVPQDSAEYSTRAVTP